MIGYILKVRFQGLDEKGFRRVNVERRVLEERQYLVLFGGVKDILWRVSLNRGLKEKDDFFGYIGYSRREREGVLC